jgi:hypothetical protein
MLLKPLTAPLPKGGGACGVSGRPVDADQPLFHQRFLLCLARDVEGQRQLACTSAIHDVSNI